MNPVIAFWLGVVAVCVARFVFIIVAMLFAKSDEENKYDQH